jgi:SAM-dependent methyltransferase
MSHQTIAPQARGPAAPDEWHLRLFEKSLLKQAKLAEIAGLIGKMADGQTWLDLGGDNGVISYHLRHLGGTWHSADLDEKTVASIRRLVGERVYQVEGARLPFEDGMFDGVVVIDMLEHLQNDAQLIAECHRVLKPAGRLIVNVPHLKKRAILRPIRRLLGLTDARHGHVRPGYTDSELFDLLKNGFDVQEARTYSRFFVESLDTLIQLVTRRMNRGQDPGRKGNVVDEQDFRKMEKAFRWYARLYPFFQFAAGMDTLLGFTKGYSLIMRARRRPWRPRRAPVLSDGRSIAEAALGGKIGSAAPF